jgi:DNA polymerase-3 subunit epsilon
MGRCCSPCLGDLDPNAYRRQIEKALGVFDAPEDAEALLLDELDRRIAEASAARRYESATALQRRRERLDKLLGRLQGMLRAVHAEPRLLLARHPAKDRFDAFWIVHGRVVDWGPLPDPGELAVRTERALAHGGGAAAPATVPPDEVDEVRIASAWIAEHDPAALALDPAPMPAALARFARAIA